MISKHSNECVCDLNQVNNQTIWRYASRSFRLTFIDIKYSDFLWIASAHCTQIRTYYVNYLVYLHWEPFQFNSVRIWPSKTLTETIWFIDTNHLLEKYYFCLVLPYTNARKRNIHLVTNAIFGIAVIELAKIWIMYVHFSNYKWNSNKTANIIRFLSIW